MPVSKEGINKLFKDWIRDGLSLSLHTHRPTASGRPYLVKKTRLSSGAIKVQGNMLRNPNVMNLGLAEFEGTGRWIGIWMGNTLMFSSKLKRPVTVTTNTTVVVPARSFQVTIRD